MIERAVAGQKYELPAGHAYSQPAMTVTASQVKDGEWVAYENDTHNGCSRYDYFCQNATAVQQKAGEAK